MSTDSKSNVTIGDEAIAKMLKGISVATQAIRLTYGAAGSNAVIESDLYPYHQVANDAQTIIQAIHVTDPVEKRGLGFLKELSDKANKDSGDGRKTTCIIAEEIIKRGYESKINGITLKKELDSFIPFIEEQIDERKKSITINSVGAVATIASESRALGQVLQEIYFHIGPDGIIYPEGSGTYSTNYTIITGVRFSDSGYLSPYMVHDEEAEKENRKATKAIYKNPTILVTKRKISHINDINPLLETLTRQGKKDLVIFTDDMDSGVASVMVKAHQDRVLNILIIKAPVLWKNYIFEDFARVVGATIVEDATGITFKNLQLNHLGTCEQITVDKDETIIIGGADISDHIAALKAEGSNDSLLRLSWLTTKTALLKLGANNESELSYIRLKCEDAINASRLALRDGVVAGGGSTLFSIAKELPDTVAGNILREALKAPIKQMLDNVGYEGTDNSWYDGVHGFDIRTLETVDMFERGIIDAATVTKNAVRNAIALASTVLTSNIVVTIPAKSAEQIADEQLKAKGLRF